MNVRVGPVAAGSAAAWVAYARDVLASTDGGTIPLVESDTVDAFIAYLDEWAALATRGDPFVWEGDVDPERLEYLAHAFARIVDHLAALADERGAPGAPPEGDEFYQALVASIIDALDAHDEASQEFSEQLRDRWPGLRKD